MKCFLCEARKARRYCPGVRADICSQCCGTERENTVECPLDCGYLREAHAHEKRPDLDPSALPNTDIRVTDDFLLQHEPLVIYLSIAFLEAAQTTPGSIDFDIRDALDSLIRTYRTLESGLYYETQPANLLAANIQARVQASIATLRNELKERGAPGVRDAEILGVLVFLQRLELAHNNGRRRGRAFLEHLFTSFPKRATETPVSSSLIQV